MPENGRKVGYINSMEHKKSKKRDGGGLYIAICCCILVIALIGYANNLAEKNKEEERLLAQEAGESIIAPEADVPVPATSAPTPAPTQAPQRNAAAVTPAPENVPVAKAQVIEEEPLLLTPVNGSVMGEFSKNKQVYHASLDDWRTHNGVDIGANVGDSVAAAADGVVARVYMGSLGYSIRIDHSDGLSTVYCNLDENPTVGLGDNVKKGDVIGHVGQSALGDMCSEPHLHFEVMLDGAYQDPAEYLQ